MKRKNASQRTLDAEDCRWMALALDAARKGIGRTSPNPPVGAVVVSAGQAKGVGYHRYAGAPHAEINALAAAGAASVGATLYVSLEPCSTRGRTPPCTQAIMEAGVRRVVVGCRDPNPRHNGKGLRGLRLAGIDVSVGCLRAECECLIEPFATWVTSGRPLVTLKLALSLDGRIADACGQSRWITGEAARREVQRLRSTADAIIVGAETLRADNPALLLKRGGRQPQRVILTRTGRIPPSAQVFTDDFRTLTRVFHLKRRLSPELKTIKGQGVRVECIATSPQDGGRTESDMMALLKRLGAEGIIHVVCEGGGAMAASLLQADVVDRLILFLAPRIIGGSGRASVSGSGWLLKESGGWAIREAKRIGDDVMLEVARRRT